MWWEFISEVFIADHGRAQSFGQFGPRGEGLAPPKPHHQHLPETGLANATVVFSDGVKSVR